MVDSHWTGVNTEHVVARPKEIDKIASVTASGIQHAHARGDASAQQLVEDVDVNLSELVLECRHAVKAY